MKITGLKQLSEALDEAASGGFQKQAAAWLEQAGLDFLELISREIIQAESVDTGRLLRSFRRGAEENIWIVESGGLSLELGTELEYASFVNDGHWTGAKDGIRWIPGRWQGGRFFYDPGSTAGMALKRKWVEGTGYWEHAFSIFARLFEERLSERLETWLDSL
ncbi:MULTISPECIES: HK97 gp10 family phage protein [unclassified Bacillus (in: firmicutes)]|uniref:HK97 gp10 family phage protein n=1 Tax=unclassified Bacillus (in: firmicutes) TaxID=185979 RepID=UPI00041DEADA|nr:MULTISPECIES: HK97 gp10 family phage protein [unclassified Bacillus (in: firmicutes)]QHZ46427.1 HK97 gp10 family phage protein [Bacillus sp. NSP9.1]WFA06567.1 HK97 gp10 family phage protein [Bacillus sp. HSf4]